MLIALLPLGGCGGESTGPQTHPVTGIVTLDGRPVEGALVQFTPMSDDIGNAGAQANTDADGKFDISMVLDMGKTTKRGLPLGDYKVTAIKKEVGAGAASLDNPPRNILPVKFASVETTPLQLSVKEDGENYIEIAL